MDLISLLDVSVDFKRSHLIFPIIISLVLAALLVAILATRHRTIFASIGSASQWSNGIDFPRLLGTVGVIVIYFLAMTRISTLIPNRGFGFLFASVPFVLAISLLYMHDRTPRKIAIALANAAIGPLAVWGILSNLFNVTLP